MQAAENLVDNGDLAKIKGDGTPEKFKLKKKSGVKAEIKVVEGAGYNGSNALHIKNENGKSGRVVLQQFIKLKEGQTYKLSCMVKGKAGGFLSFAHGKMWSGKRLWLRNSDDWKKFEVKFVVTRKSFSWGRMYELSLLSEDNCDVYVSDIRLEEADAAQILSNGDFSEIDKNGFPASWKVRIDKGVNAEVYVGKGTGPGGTNSLVLKNKSNYGGGRIALRQYPSLIAGQSYELSCKVKGGSGGFLSFALGKKWGRRLWLRSSKDWKEYKLTFAPDAKNFSWGDAYELCLLVEDECDTQVADVMLKPVNALTGIAGSYSPQEDVLVVKKIKSFDPEITSLPEKMPVLRPTVVEKFERPAKGDLEAQAVLGYDDKGLVLYVDVKDDKFISRPGEAMWNADSVQLVIEPSGNREQSRSKEDLEIGFTNYAKDTQVYSWTLHRAPNEAEVQSRVTPKPGGYFVAARIGWDLIPAIKSNPGGAFTFNLTVNDSDDGQERKGISLARGLFVYKNNKENFIGFLEGKRFSARLLLKSTTVSDKVEGVLVMMPKSDKVSLRLVGEDGTKDVLDIPLLTPAVKGVPMVAGIEWDIKKIAAGKKKLELLDGVRVIWSGELNKQDFYGSFLKGLEAVKTKYAALDSEINANINTPAIKAAKVIYDMQMSLLGNDLKKCKTQEDKDYYGWRGGRIVAELGDLLSHTQNLLKQIKDGKQIAEVGRYVSSEFSLVDGYMQAQVVKPGGTKEQRPIIFNGYGHFNTAINDLPMFNDVGANFIQFEIPMYAVVKSENDDGSFNFDWDEGGSGVGIRFAGIDRAWENNVAVCLLLGTHYFPSWALKAHPEVEWNSGSFLHFDVQHPYAKKMLEAYIRETVKRVKKMKGAKGVHSICISNEPRYQPGLKSEFTRKRFIDYLKAKYSTVAGMNEAYGKAYESFEQAAPKYNPDALKDPGLYYDFSIFKLNEFDEWHSWMAGIVQEVWPGMPVHSKVLHGFGFKASTDYERFGRWSTLNGTDSSTQYNSRTGKFRVNNMDYALMRSVNPASIVNSENHIIPDDVEEPVSYDAVYLATFSQYLNGVSASAIWVWEDYDLSMFKKHHVFVGDIYRRPMGLMALRDSGADANRLVDYIIEGYAQSPEIAILYSVASGVFDDTYNQACNRVWQKLEQNGRHARFISEDQLAAGKTGGVKVIIAPNVAVMTEKAAQKLLELSKNGVVVIASAKSFSKNPYGKKLDADITYKECKLEQLPQMLDEVAGKLGYSLISDNPVVRWRYLEMKNGKKVVYIANYSNKPAAIELSEGGTDLISKKDYAKGKLKFKPFGILMLELK